MHAYAPIAHHPCGGVEIGEVQSLLHSWKDLREVDHHDRQRG